MRPKSDYCPHAVLLGQVCRDCIREAGKPFADAAAAWQKRLIEAQMDAEYPCYDGMTAESIFKLWSRRLGLEGASYSEVEAALPPGEGKRISQLYL